MIQAVGYTDEGTVFAKMVLKVEDQPYNVTLHMKPDDARKFAGDLNSAADAMLEAEHERDSQNADQSSAA